MNVESIFKVTEYGFRYGQQKREQVIKRCVSFHSNLNDAINALHRLTPNAMTYCIVISQLPIGLDLDPFGEDSLSERVYDGSGNLVSERPFALIHDRGHAGPTTPDWIEWFQTVRHFDGWEKAQLKFSPGDIVEIHCREGNRFFGNSDKLELGIIVSFPDNSLTATRDCYKVIILSNPKVVDYAPITTVFYPRPCIKNGSKRVLMLIYDIYQVTNSLL